MTSSPLSATAHGQALQLVSKLHNYMQQDPSVMLDQASRMSLLNACFATLDAASCRFANEDTEDMQRTHQLLFMLMYTNREVDQDTNSWNRSQRLLMGTWLPTPLNDVMSATESTTRSDEETPTANPEDTRTLPEEEGDKSLQRKCTIAGLGTLCVECHQHSMVELTTVFLICARDAVFEAMLKSARLDEKTPTIFLEEEKFRRTKSVANQASSEMGQNALKDLILSFRMPRGTVGMRRTLLLSRETSSSATRYHTNLVHLAHEAAMLSAEHVWLDTEYDDVSRICALLSGVAMLYARDAQDVRDNDAFSGMVELPFLHSSGERRGVRLKLIQETWICYDTTQGHIRVYSEGVGVDGLVEAVLHLTALALPD